MSDSAFSGFLSDIWTALDGDLAAPKSVVQAGEGSLPSVFAVSDLAAASVGAAGLAAAVLIARRHDARPEVRVDRRLASFWFGVSLRPQGWALPPAWDPVAGDYAAADGWIRLHTNAPHHRAAALDVLGVQVDKEQVARAVARWNKAELETAVVGRGGCAAAMHTLEEWAAHPQGRAVAAEPLVRIDATAEAPRPDWPVPQDRPLQGIRVLDLTRVLAGPVATRFLAGLGAEVLRIDPPDWDEPGVVPDVLLGKRAARLDLRTPEGRAAFERLLTGADVLVHGYRSDVLSRLGFDTARLQMLRPGLVDVALDAYGWTGPWRARRGFDSLVQMSSGIADAGMRRLGKDRPHPLPVQALDHACGYVMAAAALTGLRRRLETGSGSTARASLARIAALLVSRAGSDDSARAPEAADDFDPAMENTAWGPARRMKAPVSIGAAPLQWDRAAGPLGTASPAWL
ncbi:MAG TPA: CoA transferase [Acetobacteraceae bacterium]|nr:CoA transferase [Acetobacteraceae bacterium]